MGPKRRFNCIILASALLYGVGVVTAAPPPWWQPAPGTTWQLQLNGTIDTSHDVEMYDIDLFDAPQETIDALHADGSVVVCYFSAGSFENWRPDVASFPSAVKGKKLEGWPGERWLDIRNLAALGPIMEARLDLAVSKNCDGVDPDNVNGFENDTGFPLLYADQLAYNVFLAAEAHERELSVGLKNDLNQVVDLVDDFDWMLNEQCYEYDECDMLLPFISAGKAVFGVEYIEEGGNPLKYCPELVAMQFSWLIKTYDLQNGPLHECSDYLPVEVVFPTESGTAGISPAMLWSPHAAGVKYRVFLTRVANGKLKDSGWLPAASVCSADPCQYTPPGTLKLGAYTLKIKTKWPGALRKPSSAKIHFTVE